MQSSLLQKIIGCIFIISSCIIGAGMLALPLVGASIGFIPSVILLCSIWLLLMLSSMCIIELTSALPLYNNHFNSMAQKTLGRTGQLCVNISFLVLLYAIVGAYIAGGSSLLTIVLSDLLHYPIPPYLCTIVFTIFLGFFIFNSTKTVDYLLRGLMSFKLLLLLAALFFMAWHINPNLLVQQRGSLSTLYLTLPIFLISLAYNIIIPSLVNYVGNHPKELLKAITIGSLVPLMLFVGWLAVTLGIIPFEGANGFQSIIEQKKSVGGLMVALHAQISEPIVYQSFSLFSNIALTASFLAVGLALFDFIADACKRKNTRLERLQTSLIAFIPPLLFALLYPQGFIYALNLSALAICLIQLILPPMMLYKMRQQKILTPTYTSPLGNKTLLLIGLIGILFLIASIINVF